MENDLSEKLKQMLEVQLPLGLHARVMASVIFLKFRTKLILFSGLLSLGLVFSGWHIWIKIRDVDALGIMQTVFSGFQADFSFVNDFIQTFYGFFPVTSIFIFLVNLTMMIFLGYLIFAFKKMSFIKGRTSVGHHY